MKWIWALSVAVIPSVASAQEDFVFEESHEVLVGLSSEADMVNLGVRRAFVNGGFEDEELNLHVELPEEAVMSGLWVLSDNGWIQGTVVDPDLGREGYYAEELMRPGHVGTIALAEWSVGEGIQIRVFPLRPMSETVIAYRVEVPSLRQNKRQTIHYPYEPDPNGTDEPQVIFANDGKHSVEDLKDELSISLQSPRVDRVEHRLGAAEIGPDRTMAHLSIDLPDQLEPATEKLSLVFVLDASRSMSRSGLAAELQLISAYLAHVPDAAVEVVVFRRYAERVFSTFVSAYAVPHLLRAAMDTGRLKLGNGSDLESGLELAAKALANRPRSRVVFVTDARMADGFDVRRSQAVLGQLANGVEVLGAELAIDRGASSVSTLEVLTGGLLEPGEDDYGLTESRVDDSLLSPIPLSFSGVYLQLDGLPSKDVRGVKKLVEGLVRPIRIDHFSVEGGELSFPETLDEGFGYSSTAMNIPLGEQIVLRGEIWSRPFERVVTVEPSWTRSFVSALFAGDYAPDLDPGTGYDLAATAGVLSRWTSFIVAKPTIQAPPQYLGGIGMHGFGTSCGCGGSSWGTARLAQYVELPAEVREGARRCMARHQRDQGWRLTLQVQVDLGEIVDVDLDRRDPLSECIEESVWAVQLPQRFDTVVRRYVLGF